MPRDMNPGTPGGGGRAPRHQAPRAERAAWVARGGGGAGGRRRRGGGEGWRRRGRRRRRRRRRRAAQGAARRAGVVSRRGERRSAASTRAWIRGSGARRRRRSLSRSLSGPCSSRLSPARVRAAWSWRRCAAPPHRGSACSCARRPTTPSTSLHCGCSGRTPRCGCCATRLLRYNLRLRYNL